MGLRFLLNFKSHFKKYSQDSNIDAEYFFLDPSNSKKIPRHVAIIMDGNGRWAKKRGLPRFAGHRAGYQAVRSVVAFANKIGIAYLTLYTFSAENWKRPKEEVDSLMGLFTEVIEAEAPFLHERGIRFKVIGRLADLPCGIQDRIKRAESLTAENTGLTLVIALNYGGRSEIIDAVKSLLSDLKKGLIDLESLDENDIRNHLYLPELPDPELVIRTSGEERMSNFLIWQAAYAEFWTTKTLWPDFTENHLKTALLDFLNRKRRFGGVEEQ